MPSTVTQDDLDKLRRDLAEEFAPSWLMSEVERLRGWRKQLEADSAFGNIMGSTQWVGGASIVDGTVQGKKFAAEVTISSLFTTAEAPADRWELDTGGIRQYATVSGVGNQKIVDINSTGFQFGTTGNNVISFNAATGVLSAPGLQTTSLSIANVTSGTIGGTYDTSVANPKVQLSPNGLRAFNAGGTKTVDIAGGSGNVTITGTFEISNSTIGDRIQLKDTGVELWRNGTRQFYLAQGSSNAIQMLLAGPSASQYIGMQPDTGFWVGASTLASAPFRVSATGVMTAIGGTFQSASSFPRVDLTASGLIAYDATGTQTVNVSGTSATITGGLIRTASSGSRVEMDSTGIHAYSGVTEVARIGTNGTGFLGNSGGSGLTWSGTTVSVDGAALTASSVTGSKIASSTIGSANIGSGAIGTAHIQSAAVGDAQIGSVSAAKITTGTISANTISFSGSGKISNSDGDEWNAGGIILNSVGNFGDAIQWRTSGSTVGSISSSTSAGLNLSTATSRSIWLIPGSGGSTNIYPPGGGATCVSWGDTDYRQLNRGRIYPGNASAVQQNYYVDGGGIISNGVGIGGMLGISSGNTINFIAPGTGGSAGFWSSWGGAPGAGYFQIQINGSTYWVPFLVPG